MPESGLIFTAWLAMDDMMDKKLQIVGIKRGEPEGGYYVKVRESVLEIIRNALRQRSVKKGHGDGDSDVFGTSCQEPLSRFRRPDVRPCGTARSIAERKCPRLSGRSVAVKVVRHAIIPQPISTPTAAGIIALFVGMTEPTVAPIPT